MAKRSQVSSSSIDYEHFEGIPSPNGTIVPDIVLDWIMPDLSNAEMRVLLYVIRRTMGFKKDADAISIDQICNGLVTKEVRNADGTVIKESQRLDRGTGLSRSTALDATRSLREKNLIVGREQFDPRYGQQPTLYALKVRGAALDKGGPISRTPPMREIGQGGSEKSDGRGPVDRTPGVQQIGPRESEKSDPQTTVEQQTDDQKTDISNRESPVRHAPDINSSDSMVSQREEKGGDAYDNDPLRSVDIIAAQLSALSEEFGDDAPRASRTRVTNLSRAAGCDDELVLELLGEAAAITRSQSHVIGKSGRAGRPVRMPYLLRTLESLLHPDHPPRASPWSTVGDSLSADRPRVARGDEQPPPILETDEVWRAALGELQLILTPENYTTWLATTRVVARTGGTLRIGVPKTFHRDWLEHKLHRRVMDALHHVGYGEMRVEYVVVGEG